MRVLIVDSNPNRRLALKRRIGEGICDDQPETPQYVAEDVSVVFLHASDPHQSNWRSLPPALKQHVWLVQYGGNGLSSGFLAAQFGDRLASNPKWFAFEHGVGNDATSSPDWDPKQFVAAVEGCEMRPSGDPREIFYKLTGFDPLLEAELNFLYECLDACHDANASKWARLPASENLETIERLKKDWADHKGAWENLRDTTDPQDYPERLRELRLKKLETLRNALLGE